MEALKDYASDAGSDALGNREDTSSREHPNLRLQVTLEAQYIHLRQGEDALKASRQELDQERGVFHLHCKTTEAKMKERSNAFEQHAQECFTIVNVLISRLRGEQDRHPAKRELASEDSMLPDGHAKCFHDVTKEGVQELNPNAAKLESQDVIKGELGKEAIVFSKTELVNTELHSACSAEMRELKETLKEAQGNLARMQEDIILHEREHVKTAELHSACSTENRELKEVLEEAETTLARTQAKLKDSVIASQSRDSQHREAADRYHAEISNLKESLQKSRTQSQQMYTAAVERKNVIRDLESKNRNLTTELETAKDEFQVKMIWQQKAVKQYSSTNSKLEKSSATLQSTITELTQKMAERDRQHAELESSNSRLAMEYKRVQNQVKDQKSESTRTLGIMKLEVDGLRRTISALSVENKGLETNLAAALKREQTSQQKYQEQLTILEIAYREEMAAKDKEQENAKLRVVEAQKLLQPLIQEACALKTTSQSFTPSAQQSARPVRTIEGKGSARRFSNLETERDGDWSRLPKGYATAGASIQEQESQLRREESLKRKAAAGLVNIKPGSYKVARYN
ncbi:hypothetical protein R3P38DRAFT_2949007 [Favolaschia claudopus]|uniref:Uncharacterized protein n=1 Tax=Favolaschia claudopus TaxID=2862362 RepID=A0AAW0BJR8_9AGAR